ncbi:MAG TPA: FkbM family methyltransferase [Alphaproteobacteria bacterium]|nr:FkbM family methyltransferase [Alphaproteobacteria bacterium]
MPNKILALLSRIGIRFGARPAPSPPAEPTIITLKPSPSLRMIVHSRFDRYISPQIAATGSWEPFETELVQRFLRPGDCFVDIGANIGWYTIIAAARVGSRGQVYAFEPAAENFELAAQNVALNGLSNVRLERAAVSDQPGSATLFLSTENLGDHRLYESAEERSSETVPVICLDAYFADKPGSIRLVKMDTQGSEAKIFAGLSPDLIRERDIEAFIFEYWPKGLVGAGSSPKDFMERLKALGLRCYVIQEDYRGLDPIDIDVLGARADDDLRPETDRFANLLALPADKSLPDWAAAMVRGPDAPMFYPSPG